MAVHLVCCPISDSLVFYPLPPFYYPYYYDDRARSSSDSGVCGLRWAVLPISLHCALQQRTSDGIIDLRVFQGVVDLNDTDSTDFSTQMVNTYLAVATSTLADMDRAVCVTTASPSFSLSPVNRTLPFCASPPLPALGYLPLAVYS
jgi:hypothetical protein